VQGRLPNSFLITAQQTLSAARQRGLDDERLTLSGVAVLTFSKAVVDRLEVLCDLKDAAWLAPQHHPYAVRAVFLVCAAWSLGPPVQFGDLIVPAFSIGHDGTSIHYGNSQGEAHAPPEMVSALREACHALDARHHAGGNGTCEALYRITPHMADDLRRRGCLCMDNGEASTLFAVTRALNVLGGVLFQPYIELAGGWDPAWLRDERYRHACHLQAEVVLHASTWLERGGLLGVGKPTGGSDDRTWVD
jgi:hypothetical protein